MGRRLTVEEVTEEFWSNKVKLAGVPFRKTYNCGTTFWQYPVTCIFCGKDIAMEKGVVLSGAGHGNCSKSRAMAKKRPSPDEMFAIILPRLLDGSVLHDVDYRASKGWRFNWSCPKGHDRRSWWYTSDHIYGCRVCSNVRTGINNRLSDEFIRKDSLALLPPGSVYRGYRRHPDHSLFLISWTCPNGHDRETYRLDMQYGSGCRFCFDGSMNPESEYWGYYFKIQIQDPVYMIGLTKCTDSDDPTKDLHRRYAYKSDWEVLELIRCHHFPNALDAEKWEKGLKEKHSRDLAKCDYRFRDQTGGPRSTEIFSWDILGLDTNG